MAKFANLIKMSTATSGTGTVSFGTAVSGFLAASAASGLADGDVVTYVLEDGSNREIGRGTLGGSKTTLTRDTVLASTNSGSAINLSGSATVGITVAAEDFLQMSSIGLTAAEKRNVINNVGLQGALAVIHRDLGGI